MKPHSLYNRLAVKLNKTEMSTGRVDPQIGSGLTAGPVKIFDHPRSGVVYNFGRVCLSVCHSREYGSSSHIKVIGSRSRSQEHKVPSPATIAHNSGTIKIQP